ncbi:DUF6907 domain-containing protein [Streptomyces ossamyceticus]|uniref:DUF6907 domain-containing protein n=1 Tax=Streptomyces ossamyceticus TaxID=249581 RepID=UPI0006E22C04|nr:hypothetical protein [Streptomyces ossamyceticus]
MSTTVQIAPMDFGEILADADEARANPSVARTRAQTTVAEILAEQEREAVRRSVDAQFPAVAAFLDEESAECPEWCFEPKPHRDHVSAAVALRAPGEAHPYIDARLLDFGNGPIVGLAEADLTPQQAVAEAAKLRAFAGSLEGLARYACVTSVTPAASRDLGPEEPGHYAWCAPGKCFERRWPSGETLTEHESAEVVLRAPVGTSGAPGALLSAALYADSDCGRPGLSFDDGAEGVALAPEAAGEVVADVAEFLEGLRALHAQLAQESVSTERRGECAGLGGGCVTDHQAQRRSPEDVHCAGPRVTMAGPVGGEFPEVYLSQWAGDAPRLVVGEGAHELDVEDVDGLLSDLNAFARRLRVLREQLDALRGGAR